MRLHSILASTFIAGATLLAPAAQAASVVFNFAGSAISSTPGTNGWGNSYTYAARDTVTGQLVSGLTATVTAWSLTSGNSNLTFESSRLGQHGANYGLGICNRDESCTAPLHAADSNGGDDFFLIRFSAPVDPASVTIRPIVGAENCGRWTCTVTSDADLSYAIGNLAATTSPSGLTIGQLQTALNDTLTSDANAYTTASQVVTLTNTGSFDTLLLGADGNDSFFKLVSLTVDYTPAGNVPVPGTVALLGLAALGLGVARRRG